MTGITPLSGVHTTAVGCDLYAVYITYVIILQLRRILLRYVFLFFSAMPEKLSTSVVRL